jgi:hypothetical protein
VNSFIIRYFESKLSLHFKKGEENNFLLTFIRYAFYDANCGVTVFEILHIREG